VPNGVNHLGDAQDTLKTHSGQNTVDFENRFPCGDTRCVSRPVPETTANLFWLIQQEPLRDCVASYGVFDFRVNVKYCKSVQTALDWPSEGVFGDWLGGEPSELQGESSRIEQGNVDFSSRLSSLAARYAESDATIRSLPIQMELGLRLIKNPPIPD
jgi:hypothetical protein